MALVSDLYRVTWYWEALGQGGSETMMLRRQQSAINVVADGIIAFIEKRAKLLGYQGTLRAYRVAMYTDAAANRVRNISELRYTSFPGTQTSTAPGSTSGPNYGENLAQSLQLMCYEPVQQKKKIIYLGYPWEKCLDGDQRYTPIPSWTTLFGSWLTDLTQGGWGWLGNTPAAPVGINDYTQNVATGNVSITLLAPITVPTNPNTPFPITMDWTTDNPLNGRHMVTAVSATEVVTVKPIGVRPFTQAGVGVLRTFEPQFYSLNYGFPSTSVVGRVGVVQPVRRARGKPMPATRGRSPELARW